MRRALAKTLILAAGALGLLPAAAGAATPAAAWQIETVPYPSAFEAGSAYGSLEVGPAYLVQAYNVGAKATSGTFTVTDTLPKGLLPSSEYPPNGLYGPQSVGSIPTLKMSCSKLGRKVTCTGGTEGPVGPGESISVIVPVEVDAGAAGTLENTATIEGGEAGVAETSAPTPVSAAPSPFGFIAGPDGLHGSATEEDGTEARLAGSHPYQLTTSAMNLTTNRNGEGFVTLLASGGGLREATVSLPQGMVVDPQATEQCKESELESSAGCPKASQVGTIALALSVKNGFGKGPALRPLYNMVSPPGYPGEFGFEVVGGSYVHLLGGLRSDGSFTLTAVSRDVLARVAIGGVRPTLWGEPSDESHDAQRSECLNHPTLARSECAVPRTRRAFVTLPAACSGPLVTGVLASSWLGEEAVKSYTAPQAVEGCSALAFEPQIEARPTTQQADSPSGLDFRLTQTENQQYEDEAGNPQRSTAPLMDTTVQLPEGMTLNPSAANGLQPCTAAQIGLATAAGQTPIRYREEPVHCPNDSKLGTVSVTTPLIDHALPGAIYLAKPFENPFGSLLGLYLVVEDERSGVIAKLAGRVDPNPVTGRLSTTFAENPQMPLSEVHLSFFEGARGALLTPLSCGVKTITGQLSSWSGNPAVAASSSFAVTSSPAGGCPASEAEAPAAATLSAGTTEPLAGRYSPFVLKIGRDDGTQRIDRVDTTLPQGLTGRLASIPYCSEAQIAAAEARKNPEEGKLEQSSPSCPAASDLGTVAVAAGAGPYPVHASGHAYLAGPYKGAPLSLAVIVPAVTGPFDLGVVVVRVALEVDLETAQIHAVSDPLPTILAGIPLDVRQIVMSLDRSGFTLNPTRCAAQPLLASVGTPAGATAQLSERFSVEGCRELAFKPKLTISLKGSTKRSGHPSLKAVVSFPKKGAFANISRAQVGLPHSEFLDNENLDKVCNQAHLQAGTCPKKSIYGQAKAWTPLLEKPLEGPVYLGVGYGHKLPDLVADLNGQIRILVHARVDTTKGDGIRNTFEVVPDAPVSRFVVQMKGGKNYSLIENSQDICVGTHRASARFRAHNGRVAQLHPELQTSCKKKGKGHKKRNKGHGRGR